MAYGRRPCLSVCLRKSVRVWVCACVYLSASVAASLFHRGANILQAAPGNHPGPISTKFGAALIPTRLQLCAELMQSCPPYSNQWKPTPPGHSRSLHLAKTV